MKNSFVPIFIVSTVLDIVIGLCIVSKENRPIYVQYLGILNIYISITLGIHFCTSSPDFNFLYSVESDTKHVDEQPERNIYQSLLSQPLLTVWVCQVQLAQVPIQDNLWRNVFF